MKNKPSVQSKPTFVLNDSAKTPAAVQAVADVQKFTVNFLPKQCRVETLEGREHIVVPMVILVEGVHHGSNGPLLYEEGELSKCPSAWDHKPVVVYHPMEDGEGISACRPDILNTRKVGIMLNTVYESPKLKSEAWIEKSRADEVDERVMAAITMNEVMEVSTGLAVDKEVTEGEFKGETYEGIARNFRPDHLAILPDQIGACSVAKGAGLLRNAAHKDPSGKGLAKLKAVIKELGLVDNEMSFSNIQQDLTTAIRAKFVPKEKKDSWVWVVDVYSNFAIYEHDGKLLRLGYTASDTGVSLSDDAPVEVNRVTEYRTVAGAKFVGNRDQSKKDTKMNAEQKKKLINALIVNKASGWSEEDRPTLEAMKDGPLEALDKAINPPKKEEEAPTPPVINKEQAPAPAFDFNAWMNSAPSNVQEMVQNGTAVLKEEKTKLVTEITANKNNVFTPDYLNARPLNELRGIAALSRSTSAPATQSSGNYFGAGAPTLTDNAEPIEALGLPEMTWNESPEKP